MTIPGDRTATCKTILLKAGPEASFERVLAAGVAIGRHHGSCLIGLEVWPRPVTVPAGVPGAPDAVEWDRRRKGAQAEGERMRRQLERGMATVGRPSQWIVGDEGDRTGWLEAWRTIRAADLIIAPAQDDRTRHLSPRLAADELLLAAGRPVLAIPRGAEVASLPGRVIIALSNTREAARAAFDALPLLGAAGDVNILSVVEERDAGALIGSRRAGVSLAAGLAAALTRHGVRARTSEIDLTATENGAVLLAAAKAERADMIVMGGYGHSRLGELLLGGTTRHVLSHTHVPVLLSH